MPFSRLYQQHHGSHDFHDDQSHYQHHVGTMPHPQQYQWSEMDFTTVPLGSKYPNTMVSAENLAQLQAHAPNQRPAPISTSMYHTGPFTYNQLLDMSSEISPLDQDSIPSSRADSSRMFDDDEQDNLQSSDMSKSRVGVSVEKICPLISGQAETCQSQRCGPDAPCLNFNNLPPIEECTSVPCITSPATTRPPIKRDSSESSQEPLPYGNRTGTSSSEDIKRPDAKTRAKQAHSLVERKYRENLNAKISQLHSTLHHAHYGPKFEGRGYIATSSSSSKFRKSDVLTDAMNYVNQTEVEMRHMEAEIHRLNERVRLLEKLVRCEDCSLLKGFVGLQVQTV